MRPPRLLAVSAVLVSTLAIAFAGDPVPDVDVILEQVPGGVVLEVSNGAPFDRLSLGGSRGFLGGLEPQRLPPGWAMTREGKQAVLSGPAVSDPTRIRLRTGRTVDKQVDWEVSIAGRTLASRRNVVPRTRPPRVVKNSLQGIVVMPEKVSPGEAVALRPLPGAELPPGHFVLSGVVMEPLGEDDLANARAIVNTTRSQLKSGASPAIASPPAAGFELSGPDGSSCADLLPVAAALIGAGSTGDCAPCKSFFESPSGTANRTATVRVTAPADGVAPSAGDLSSWDVADLGSPPAALAGAPSGSRARHDLAMNSIRSLKAFYAVAPTKGSEDGKKSSASDPQAGQAWDLAAPDGTLLRMQIQHRPPPRPTVQVALEGADTPSGCRVTAREPDLFDLALARQAQKPRHDRPEGKSARDTEAALVVGRVPGDLLPGTQLSLQYVDSFGDVVVDVPAVDATQVVPPPVDSEPPCVTAATAFAQPLDTVCVCGNFPSAAAQAALWVDERDAGTPVSLSTRTLQFQLPPHAQVPGRHVWSGDPEAGYVPSCRAWTQVVQVAGAIDSERLWAGESTPMRLTVSGTDAPVPIRIRNLTPGIVRIEGGEEQTVESSGGAPNLVTRPVQGLVRGTFDIEWSLAAERCPCR